MKISTPSCSAFAQNGWSPEPDSSTPLTLPPISAPRSPRRLTPSSSCSTRDRDERAIVELNAQIARLGAEQRDSLGVLLLIANDPTVRSEEHTSELQSL